VSIYHYRVIAEDVGGLNESVNMAIRVQPEPIRPRFVRRTYQFVLRGDAVVGDRVGRVEAVDHENQSSVQIIYFLSPATEWFTVNRSNGIITVARNLREMENSGRRRRRDTDPALHSYNGN